ncbi:MAG: right-handed parallel beta-helix repeat-containing protein [Patescibacteria group bacterium]
MKKIIINIVKILIILIAVIFVFIIVSAVANQNILNGKVSGISIRPQTWSGDIIVTGDVLFAPWVSLAIKPGTKIFFEKKPDIDGTNWTKWADAYIKDHNDPTGKEGYAESHFDIAAKIIALGTQEEPIVFTSAQTNKEYADWDQLVLFSGSRLENTEISYAHNGVNISGNGVSIRNSKIHDSLWSCIDVFSGGSVIEGNEVYHCWHQAIGVKVPGNNIVRGNFVHDAQLGINCEFGADPEIINNRFFSAPYGQDCSVGKNNEIQEWPANTEGGTYSGVLIYPSNQ